MSISEVDMRREDNVNSVRCLAHECITALWENGKESHLQLLLTHCQRALEEPKRLKKKRAGKDAGE